MLTHDHFDKFATRWLTDYLASGKSIYCRAGCAGCCNLAVHATFPEAVEVSGQLTPHISGQLSTYITRLQRTLPEAETMKSYLRLHRKSIGPCPFLDSNGQCEIYLIRPLSCRALLSTRPADWCTVDFAELEQWDKMAFESSLDRETVAWPTHYVAATQESAREFEHLLLEEMKQQKGWALSGNFAVMVWLERKYQLSSMAGLTDQSIRKLLAEHHLDNQLILTLS